MCRSSSPANIRRPERFFLSGRLVVWVREARDAVLSVYDGFVACRSRPFRVGIGPVVRRCRAGTSAGRRAACGKRRRSPEGGRTEGRRRVTTGGRVLLRRATVGREPPEKGRREGSGRQGTCFSGEDGAAGGEESFRERPVAFVGLRAICGSANFGCRFEKTGCVYRSQRFRGVLGKRRRGRK